MDKSSVMDMVLDRLLGDMDSTEGQSAMSHSMEDCPNPLTCTDHDSDAAGLLAPDHKPEASIEVHKIDIPPGEMPSLDDKGEEGESLSPEDAEILKKLLRG